MSFPPLAAIIVACLFFAVGTWSKPACSVPVLKIILPHVVTQHKVFDDMFEIN